MHECCGNQHFAESTFSDIFMQIKNVIVNLFQNHTLIVLILLILLLFICGNRLRKNSTREYIKPAEEKKTQ